MRLGRQPGRQLRRTRQRHVHPTCALGMGCVSAARCQRGMTAARSAVCSRSAGPRSIAAGRCCCLPISRCHCDCSCCGRAWVYRGEVLLADWSEIASAGDCNGNAPWGQGKRAQFHEVSMCLAARQLSDWARRQACLSVIMGETGTEPQDLATESSVLAVHAGQGASGVSAAA